MSVSSARQSRLVVEALLRAGVRRVVLAPGSRNAPLSLVLHEAERRGLVELHVRVDERTAGFLALGMAKAGHRPVAVLTTSGTAVANLHPAVLEAAHAGVGLVVVSADRPAALRGTLANQTTEQASLFGSAPVATLDLAQDDGAADRVQELVARTGPVHLNVQLADPLLAGLTEELALLSGPSEEPGRPERATPTPVDLPRGPRTVVVAGDDAGPPARRLAETGGWPLLAEPTSGSRTGTHPVRTYRLLLGGPLADRVERVVVAGSPTLSRPVQQLLARPDVEVASLPARGRWTRRPHPVAIEAEAMTVAGDPGPEELAWLEEWRAADGTTSDRLDALVARQAGLSPYDVAAAVSAAVPAAGLLFVGASNPVRDLDLMARPYPVGERRSILANRGLSGIDGTLSSAIGATLARRDTSRALALVGDITFLHDLNGLLVGPTEPRPDLTVVVVNDDGGSIFSTLEQGGPEHAGAFERVFATPHGADLASLCAGLRVPHWRVGDPAELRHALASPNGGLEVVEAVVHRDDRRALDEQVRALVSR